MVNGISKPKGLPEKIEEIWRIEVFFNESGFYQIPENSRRSGVFL